MGARGKITIEKGAGHRGWPFPFADGTGGRPTWRQGVVLLILCTAIHLAALEISRMTGNFDPQPHHDFRRYLTQILERGYPRPTAWPPLFAYYMAMKWRVTAALGLPYWSAKYFIDVFPVLASAALSTLLAAELTRNRMLSLLSGLAMCAAPIFILAVAEEEAVFFFQPFFLLSLLLLARELTRVDGPRWPCVGAAGAVMGVATMVRANPQIIVTFLALAILASERSRLPHRSLLRCVAFTLLFAAAQAAVMAPWAMLQRSYGKSSLVPVNNLWIAFFDGVSRHPGNPASDAVRSGVEHYPPTRAGALTFLRTWSERDPGALARLFALKAVRSWYISDSGRWDRPILYLHAPFWILAIAGVAVWLRRKPGDRALLLILLVIAYMWMVSSLHSGLARYSAPLYGLIGLLAGVPFVSRSRTGSGSPVPGSLQLE